MLRDYTHRFGCAPERRRSIGIDDGIACPEHETCACRHRCRCRAVPGNLPALPCPPAQACQPSRPDGTAVLLHLERTGPLTIGEASKHLGRAQSVVSEIVTRLERRGLIERMRDERDRRRVLVWLTANGLATIAEQRQVLSLDLLDKAVRRMSPAARQALVAGMQALISAADGGES